MAGFVFISLVLLVVVLAILGVVPDAALASAPATIVVIIVVAAMLLALVWLDKGEDLWSVARLVTRGLCWVVFFPVTCVYLLSSDRIGDLPPALEFGVVGIAAALGGLVLNAGLSSGLPCESRREFIAVAQKFIIAVILGIIFPPIVWFVDLVADGGDVMLFDPGGSSGWVLWILFWIGVFSFLVGVTFFIVALVDLFYAMIRLGRARCGCKSSGMDGSCNARKDADAS